MDDPMDTTDIDRRLSAIHQQQLTEQMNHVNVVLWVHERELMLCELALCATLLVVGYQAVTIHRMRQDDRGSQ